MNSAPAYRTYESDSLDIDPGSPFFWDHISRYWWAAAFAMDRNVLDCACGKGYGSFILSHSAKSVLGVDLNTDSIRLAKQNFSPGNLRFQIQNILELPQLSQKFDLIVAFEVIEHIPAESTDNFLESIAGILNENGRLLLSTPNHDVVRKSGMPVPEFHINNFIPQDLKQKLNEYFVEVEMLGQFRERSFFNHLLFSADIWNLRHSIARSLPMGRVPRGDITQPEPYKSPDLEQARFFLETMPEEVRQYEFSPYHWRQAGLTVAICGKPRK